MNRYDTIQECYDDDYEENEDNEEPELEEDTNEEFDNSDNMDTDQSNQNELGSSSHPANATSSNSNNTYLIRREVETDAMLCLLEKIQLFRCLFNELTISTKREFAQRISTYRFTNKFLLFTSGDRINSQELYLILEGQFLVTSSHQSPSQSMRLSPAQARGKYITSIIRSLQQNQRNSQQQHYNFDSEGGVGEDGSSIFKNPSNRSMFSGRTSNLSWTFPAVAVSSVVTSGDLIGEEVIPLGFVKKRNYSYTAQAISDGVIAVLDAKWILKRIESITQSSSDDFSVENKHQQRTHVSHMPSYRFEDNHGYVLSTLSHSPITQIASATTASAFHVSGSHKYQQTHGISLKQQTQKSSSPVKKQSDEQYLLEVKKLSIAALQTTVGGMNSTRSNPRLLISSVETSSGHELGLTQQHRSLSPPLFRNQARKRFMELVEINNGYRSPTAILSQRYAQQSNSSKSGEKCRTVEKAQQVLGERGPLVSTIVTNFYQSRSSQKKGELRGEQNKSGKGRNTVVRVVKFPANDQNYFNCTQDWQRSHSAEERDRISSNPRSCKVSDGRVRIQFLVQAKSAVSPFLAHKKQLLQQ